MKVTAPSVREVSSILNPKVLASFPFNSQNTFGFGAPFAVTVALKFFEGFVFSIALYSVCKSPVPSNDAASSIKRKKIFVKEGGERWRVKERRMKNEKGLC